MRLDNNLDSNQFYDCISKKYSIIFSKRATYNNAVDNYIKSHLNFYYFKTVLDVGSGNGDRIVKLFSGVSKITSIEESNEMCVQLRKNPQILKVIESNVEKLNMRDIGTQFNLVTMLWNVLGHVKSPDLLLKFLFETLAPRGYLIFDVNNPLNIRNYGIKSVISNWIFFYLYPRQKRKEYHWSLDGIRTSVCFSPTKYYTEILKSIGFKDIKVTFLDYNSGAPAFFATGQAVIEAFKP